jgi:hypothetical protein
MAFWGLWGKIEKLELGRINSIRKPTTGDASRNLKQIFAANLPEYWFH